MTRLRALTTMLRCERGSALAIGMMMTVLMMGLGAATLTFVEGQTKQSGGERIRESAFNLAEGAVNSQVYLLTRSWPGAAANAYPSSCTQAATNKLCPDSNALKESYNTRDYGSAPTWTTYVRDNGGSYGDFYSESVLTGQPAWDANGDHKVWVRGQATVRGQKRALVGLVQIDQNPEVIPKSTLVAGALTTTNAGNKQIIDTKGPSSAAAPVQLRCGLPLGLLCLDTGVRDPLVQIQPYTVQQNYSGGNSLSAEALDRLRARAVADGTYYSSGCPANPNGMAVVFVESGNCVYNNSTPTPCCNTRLTPGFFIVANGTFTLDGSLTYYGVVYAANKQGSSGTVVSVAGHAVLDGGIQIDGVGRLTAGSDKMNVVFDDYQYNAVKSYGSAHIVQNKWRELPPN